MTDASDDPLCLDQAGRVAWITFNRPDARNAMTFEMYERLHDLCDRLDQDPGVRVLVLRGAGDKAFVSGTDIRQFLEFKTREDALSYEARITRVLARINAMTTHHRHGPGRRRRGPAAATPRSPIFRRPIRRP